MSKQNFDFDDSFYLMDLVELTDTTRFFTKKERKRIFDKRRKLKNRINARKSREKREAKKKLEEETIKELFKKYREIITMQEEKIKFLEEKNNVLNSMLFN